MSHAAVAEEVPAEVQHQNNEAVGGAVEKEQSEGQPDEQSSESHQYITFRVNDEEYGMYIMSVLEIKGWTETTRLPNQPDYLLGVLNLRGVIVPIIDLRYRFGGGKTEATSVHVVIIVSIKDRCLGILVDAVSDILTVYEKDIQEVPKIDNSVREHFLSGLVTIKDRMVAILDLDQLKAGTAPELDELIKNAENEA